MMQAMIKTLYLFVPAVRLDRVSKAVATGVDKVIIDLEDTVADNAKDSVRQALLDFDKQTTHRYWLRINAYDTAAYQADIACVNELVQLDGLLLPKCQSAEQATQVHQQSQKPIIAMIETATGLANLVQIAQAAGVQALSFGCLDLAQSLGVRPDSAAYAVLLDKVRTDLLVYSAAYGLQPPIETIFADFANEQAFADRVAYWRDFGFAGQLLIHPKQVAIARRVLADEQDWAFAEAIYQRHEQTGEIAFAIDGKMVDLPLIQWARRLLGK